MREEGDLDRSYCTPYTPTMERLLTLSLISGFATVSWISVAHSEPCRPCAVGDVLCRTMTTGMQIPTTRIQRPCIKHRMLHNLQCVADIFASELWPELHVAGAKNTTIKEMKVRQGWSFYSFLFSHRLHSVLPYWAGRRLPTTVSALRCQLCCSVIRQ